MRLVLLAALLAAGPIHAAASRTRPFASAALGVTLRYPAAWHAFAPDPDTLSLMRPAMPFHGPIQPRGQARIVVGPSSGPRGPEAAVLHYYAMEGVMREVGRVDLRGAGTPCSHLARATIRQTVVPPENRAVRVRDIVSTVLVCTTPTATVVGSSSVWADDPQRGRAAADLLAIMRSLRTGPRAPRAPSSAK